MVESVSSLEVAAHHLRFPAPDGAVALTAADAVLLRIHRTEQGVAAEA